VTTAGSGGSDEATLPYDVFISYRHVEPDQTWVRAVLEPRLRTAGLRTLIDERDFRLGASLVLEMERAVQESRYTLAVVTPAYLLSTFTELENTLATHLGLERAERRLLVAAREATPMPLGMRARLWLDMTEDAAFETTFERLLEALRSPN